MPGSVLGLRVKQKMETRTLTRGCSEELEEGQSGNKDTGQKAEGTVSQTDRQTCKGSREKQNWGVRGQGEAHGGPAGWAAAELGAEKEKSVQRPEEERQQPQDGQRAGL